LWRAQHRRQFRPQPLVYMEWGGRRVLSVGKIYHALFSCWHAQFLRRAVLVSLHVTKGGALANCVFPLTVLIPQFYKYRVLPVWHPELAPDSAVFSFSTVYWVWRLTHVNPNTAAINTVCAKWSVTIFTITETKTCKITSKRLLKTLKCIALTI